MTTSYSTEFFHGLRESSLAGARAIVPLLIDAVHPASVIDVGCGDGSWLSVFCECGVGDVQGLDGNYVARDTLLISESHFLACNLNEPIRLSRSFDLAICLEVAEHLPVERADAFVRDLTTLAPVVLFSAAIPNQAGAQHVNEQWQEYWVRRFLANGFVPVDLLRPKLWAREDIAVWYLQNALLYVSEQHLAAYPGLASSRQDLESYPWSVVHPRLYSATHDLSNWTFRKIACATATLAIRSVGWRLRRWLGPKKSGGSVSAS